jgi:phenylpropionate dioxygenase-like ring-hydroxylating dioxygenase large terminal subunit
MNSPLSSLGELIRPDRVHGSLYTDPVIFAAELERIWYRTWVYVGHASEIATPGDFVEKSIGPQSVLMTRGRDGQIRLLLNRCAHRANLVCSVPRGNATTFRCPYHGWTFDNTGALVGVPFASGYGDATPKKGLALGRVPRVASIHGFVFGSFAVEGPSLAEHLGAAADVFDRLARLSPAGEVELTAGWLRHKVKANWKMLVENETDGYHPQFVHASIFGVAESGIGDLYGEKSTAVSRDLGGGHTENDLRPEFRRIGQPMGWFGTSAERMPDYVARMREVHGPAAESILVDGSPHVMIFPNLFIAEIQLFVIQPLAVDETVQHVTALQFKDATDLNERMLRQTLGSVGPAGFLLADDSEMYERNQVGVTARIPEWLILQRGLHRERRDADGLLIGDATDEVPQRAIWRHYRSLMEAQ